MSEITFVRQQDIPDDLLCEAVTAARYQGKWILCRNDAHEPWRLPGEERKAGEKLMDTARRALMEKTGALEMTLQPVSAFYAESAGMLFFSEVTARKRLPSGAEESGILLTDTLPKALANPDMQKPMYLKVQAWLNMQSKADELWDVYDVNRHRTGRTHRRGDALPAGDYHLVVDIWIRNRAGEYLLTKRSPNKGFPNMWEMTGGSALAGDDSLTAAMREVREETGLLLRRETGRLIWQYTRSDSHKDVWLFEEEFDLDSVVLQEGETCDKRAATRREIEGLMADGKFVPVPYWHRLVEQSAL